MSGKELYDLWREGGYALMAENAGWAHWDDISDLARATWNRFAEKLEELELAVLEKAADR